VKRPLTVWIIFGVRLTIVVAGFARLSGLIIELEAAEHKLRRQAEFDENVRGALWRMDSAVAPIIAEENSRPYFAYRPFYDRNQPYRSMFVPAEYPDQNALTPSPLLSGAGDLVKLHF
jgi:hypothetical protein